MNSRQQTHAEYGGEMLHEFLTANREELIARCREKVARRSPGSFERELRHGITPFLDQLILTLQVEETSHPMRSRIISGPAGGDAASEIGATATKHGRELLDHGYTVEEVVHDYGDLCQSVTDLAVEREAKISTDEFRTLNRSLDNAIAAAVKEFGHEREAAMSGRHTMELNERIGVFAHELRNQLTIATLALANIKDGSVGIGGATGAILDSSLVKLRNLIDRSLAEVRMSAGAPLQAEIFSLVSFISETRVSASLEAASKGCVLIVAESDRKLAISGDRDLLSAALGNLLQNAFKFTRPQSEVTLNAHVVGNRILIDVEDNCGGLAPGLADRMFNAFAQGGGDLTGVGLGLSIAKRSVEANGGALRVRDMPGHGCVFTIDLPRHVMPEPASDAQRRAVVG